MRATKIPPHPTKLAVLCALVVSWTALLALPERAGSADPRPSPQDEPWRVASYLDEAGLAGHGIFFIDFEADGTVWIAASDGLYRFDGFHWRRFDARDGLPSNYVRCVKVASDGRLWVGTDRGAGVFGEDGFDPLDTAESLAGPSVRRIVEDADGALWFCCDQWPDPLVAGGLSRLRDGQWRTWTRADGLPADLVSDYFQDSRGRRFVLSKGGLSQLVGTEIVQPWKEAGLEGSVAFVWSIAETPEGDVVATTDNHLFRLRGDQWTSTPLNLGREPQPDLLRTSDGAVLLGRRAVDGPTLELRPEGFVPAAAPLLLGDGIQAMAEAPDGAVWIVGTNMLSRWERRGGEWTTYRDLAPPRLCDDEGRIWFADEQRVEFEERGRFTSLAASAPLALGPKGRVWMRTPEGVGVWESGALRVWKAEELGLTTVRALAVDGVGRIWAADAGAAYFEDGAWHTVEMESDPASICFSIADTDSGLWLVRHGDSHRLTHVTPDGRVDLALPTVAQEYMCPKLLVDDQQRAWSYGRFGLQVHDRTSGAGWVAVDAIPGRDVFDVAQFGDEFWVCYTGSTGGSAGFARLSASGWSAVSEPSRGFAGRSGDEILFLSHQGSIQSIEGGRDAEPSRISLPEPLQVHSVVLGSEGELWIGSLGDRVLRYKADGIRPDTIVEPAGENIQHGEDLVVRVTGRERFRPPGGKFRVALRVDDGPWGEFRDCSDGHVTVAAPTVGQHVVQVRVEDEGKDFDREPESFRFRVHPQAVQERRWFWPVVTGFGIVLIGLCFAAYASHQKVSQQARTLERAVERRTEELALSERKYRALFEQSRDAICLLDSECVVTDGNRAALELLGYDRSQLVGMVTSELFVHLDGEPSFLRALPQKGAIHDHVRRARRRDGKLLDVLLTANERVGEDGDRVGFQLILRDVTRQRQLEESLKQSQKMEAIGRMAGGISHDFNNILTAILGYAELLRAKVLGNEGLKHDVDVILKEAERARMLTGQIQTFSRGKIVEPRVIDLGAVLDDIENLLVRVLGEGVELLVDRASEVGRVRINPAQLEQVLVNLAINARDAMPDGGKLLLRAVNVTLSEERAAEVNVPRAGDYVELTVTDTGVGMDLETRRKVFEPFFTTKPHGQGTGLGLAIVYGIVQQCGGGIHVESVLRRGTSFRIYFPFSADPVESVTPAPEFEIELGGGEVILVVDDEPGIRRLVAQTLEGFGYRVLVAEDGFEALRIAEAEEERIDVAVSDIVMPGMNGRELAYRLRNKRPDIRILLMTGYAQSDADTDELLEARTPILKKPFLPTALLRKLRELIEQQRV